MYDEMNFINGYVNYKLYDSWNNLIYEHDSENTITYNHYSQVTALMTRGSGATMTYFHVGSGSGQGKGSNDLSSPSSDSRIAITSSASSSGGITYTINVGAGVLQGSIEECGLFLTQTGSDMQAYDDSISLIKNENDTLTVTWTIKYG